MNKRLGVHFFALVLAASSMALTIAPSAVLATEPDEILEDPALEARARRLGTIIRCVTCQSQSINDSDAPLAKDFRVLVRERLVAGDSDEDVLAYLTDLYGDYVRMRPQVRGNTLVLWFGPLIALIIGGVVVAQVFRKPATSDKPDAGAA